MSNITNTDAVVTESKLKDFYEDIKPFLGCPAYLTSEGNAEYYSTDEKVIGRWTNGKPLYQKVIYFNPQITITANSWQNIKSDETDIECIADAIILRNDGIFIPQYGSVSPFINTRGLWVYTTQLQNTIQGIILKYTKITDSAATTIQEDSNEYSTDEKIIGKWIDDKPIYQKTFTGTVPTFTPPNNSVLDPATLDIAMDCLVDVFISVSGFIQTVAGNYVPLPFTEITKNVAYKESSSATTLDSYPQTIAAYGRPNASTSMPNNIRVVNMNQNFNNRPLWVTAQYTKTTD